MKKVPKELIDAYGVIVAHLKANTKNEALLANFEGTELRCAKALLETCTSDDSIKEKLEEIIKTSFPVDHKEHSLGGMITQGPITVDSHCPHHLYPVRYVAYVSYLPQDGQVLGLSKLARICKVLGRRPVLHEQLASDIADVLFLNEDSPSAFPSIKSGGSAVMLVGLHTCFSPDTEILTEDGWKKFENLKHGKRVVQVAQDGLSASLVVPTAYIRQKNSYDHLLHLESPGLDLLMTPDHDLLYQTSWKYHKGEGWDKCKASELPGEFYIPQTFDWQGSPVEDVIFDGYNLTANQFLALLGLYQSEGCWRGENTYQDVVYSRRGIEINQKVGTKEHKKIVKFLSTLPFEIETRRYGNIDYFFIHSNELPEYLLQFGRYCTHNRIPRIVLNATKDNIKQYLKWYYLGDGDKWHDKKGVSSTRVKGSKVVTTSSKLMARDLQEAYLKIGIVTHIHSYEGASYQNGGNKYRVWQQNTRNLRKKENNDYRDAAFARSRNIKKVMYSGDVFCVTVPLGNIVVRRNNKVAVVGNCMSCRGVQEDALTSVVELRGSYWEPGFEEKFYKAVESIKTSKIY